LDRAVAATVHELPRQPQIPAGKRRPNLALLILQELREDESGHGRVVGKIGVADEVGSHLGANPGVVATARQLHVSTALEPRAIPRLVVPEIGPSFV
jgi:hypothetical protein